MNHSGDWSAELTSQIFTNITNARESQDISAQGLSDACGRLGHPIARAVISKFDNHTRSGVSVPELLVISQALDVPFVDLLANEGEVRITPTATVSTPSAADALAGRSKRLKIARTALMKALDKLDESSTS